MRVLLDECVDRRLAYELATHTVLNVYQQDWSGIENGELLALAAQEFDVFLTVDRNLSFQQVIPKFEIAVIILEAHSNRLEDLKPLIPTTSEAISTAKPGDIIRIRK